MLNRKQFKQSRAFYFTRLILQSKLLSILLIFLMLIACSTNNRHFYVMQVGDFQKTCTKITLEQQFLAKEIKKLKNKEKVRFLRNSGLFLAAIFQAGFSVLFLDFEADQKEQIKLLEERIKHLEQVKEIKC